MTVRAVIFDFFGVIAGRVAIKWVTENFPDHRVDKIVNNYILLADKGLISIEKLFDDLGRLSSKPASIVEEEWSRLCVIDKEVIDLIKTLKLNYKVIILSNGVAAFIKRILDQNNLHTLFDELIVSSDVGLIKPDAAIFNLVIERSNLNANELLFIDDQLENVTAAIKAGITSLCFTGITSLKSFLVKKLPHRP